MFCFMKKLKYSHFNIHFQIQLTFFYKTNIFIWLMYCLFNNIYATQKTIYKIVYFIMHTVFDISQNNAV